MPNISIDQLANDIAQTVKEYTQDVSEGIDNLLDDTASKILRDVKAGAPKDTGAYAKGFKITKDDGVTSHRRIIWNPKHGWRAHLLEFGHAKRGGGRVAGKPHMTPAYDKHAADLHQQVKTIIQGGGIK